MAFSSGLLPTRRQSKGQGRGDSHRDGSGSVEDVHRRILAEIATRFGDGAG